MSNRNSAATEQGFDPEPGPEQARVRTTAREFAQRELLARAAQFDENAQIPVVVLNELAALGMFGIQIPREWGGAGLDTVSYALALEEISRACASTGTTISAHSLVCDVLLKRGTVDQKERHLRPLASGSMLAGFALTEPAGGSDAAAVKTSARAEGDSWVIDGTKSFVTNGSRAGVLLVFARTAEATLENRRQALTAFLVERSNPGLFVARIEQKLGVRGSDTALLSFEGCRVPDSNRVGDVGQGLELALAALDGGRIGIAAQALGIARACLEDSVDYARERQAFGKSIGEFQAIQVMLADMATSVDAARLLIWRAAGQRDRSEPYGMAAAMAKLIASDAAATAARNCVQIFGGAGYLSGSPAERHYRDAKVTEIYEGTSEILMLVIANEMLA